MLSKYAGNFLVAIVHNIFSRFIIFNYCQRDHYGNYILRMLLKLKVFFLS